MKKLIVIIMFVAFATNIYAQDELNPTIVPSGVDLGLDPSIYAPATISVSGQVNGREIPKDNGLETLEVLAGCGNSQLSLLLSIIYQFSDPVKSFTWLKTGYNQGRKEQSSQLGCYYLAGFGVEKNYEKAVACFRESIDVDKESIGYKHRVSTSYNNLGYCYFTGNGLPKDDYKAFEMFSKADELGDSIASYNLGYCYLNGVGTSVDEEKAVKFLLKAAEREFPQAQYLLGKNYYKENKKEAVSYYNAALDNKKTLGIVKGDINRDLSAIYRFGRCGVDIDAIKADALLEEAASYGEANSLFIKAWMEANYSELKNLKPISQ